MVVFGEYRLNLRGESFFLKVVGAHKHKPTCGDQVRYVRSPFMESNGDVIFSNNLLCACVLLNRMKRERCVDAMAHDVLMAKSGFVLTERELAFVS